MAFLHKHRHPGLWLPQRVPPQGAVLDTTHPLAANLVGLWIPGWKGKEDAAGGPAIAYSGALPISASEVGPAIDFDGATYGSVLRSIALEPPLLTVAAWVRPLTTPPQYSTIACKPARVGFWTPPYSQWQLVASDFGGVFGFKVSVSGSNYQTMSSSALPVGAWSHLVGTYDGSNIKLYRNGAFVSSYSISGTGVDYSADTTNLTFACRNSTSADEYFPGSLAATHLYNRALSATEVATLATNPLAMLRPVTARRFKTATSGTVQSATVSETLNGSDSPIATLAAAASLSETGTASDTPTPTLTSARSVTETLTGADSPTATLTTSASVSETGSASDISTPASVTSGTVGETGAVTDTLSVVQTSSKSVTEAGTVVESTSYAYVAGALVSETGSASDSVSAVLTTSASVTETGSVAETVLVGAIQVSVAESGSLAETALTSLTTAVSASETGTVSDTAQPALTTAASISENGSASDTAQPALTTAQTVIETATASDPTTAILVTTVTVSETGSVSDQVTAVLAAAVTVSEIGVLTDSTDLVSANSASITETGAASDTTTATWAATASVMETLAASDSAATGGIASVSVSETGTASDNPAATLITSASISETGTASDGVTATLTKLTSASEVATLSEMASVSVAFAASSPEADVLTDTTAGQSISFVSAAEAGSLTDTTAVALPRLVSGSAALTARRRLLKQVGRDMTLRRLNGTDVQVTGFLSLFTPTQSKDVSQGDGRIAITNDEITLSEWKGPPVPGDVVLIDTRRYRITFSVPVKDGRNLIGHDLGVRSFT